MALFRILRLHYTAFRTWLYTSYLHCMHACSRVLVVLVASRCISMMTSRYLFTPFRTSRYPKLAYAKADHHCAASISLYLPVACLSAASATTAGLASRFGPIHRRSQSENLSHPDTPIPQMPMPRVLDSYAVAPPCMVQNSGIVARLGRTMERRDALMMMVGNFWRSLIRSVAAWNWCDRGRRRGPVEFDGCEGCGMVWIWSWSWSWT